MPNILIGTPDEKKKPLERPMHKEKINIKMVLKDIGSEAVVWIHLAQEWIQWRALVNTIINLRFP
jgi:hypothetical protein